VSAHGLPHHFGDLAERIAVVAAAVTAPSPSGKRLEWADAVRRFAVA